MKLKQQQEQNQKNGRAGNGGPGAPFSHSLFEVRCFLGLENWNE